MDLEQFATYLTIEKNLSPDSVRLVISRVKILQEHLEDSPLNLESARQFLLRIKQTRSPNTYNTYIFTLKHLSDFLKLDLSSILQSVKRKRQKRIEILSISEIKRLLMVNMTYGIFRGKDTQFLNEMYKTFSEFLAHTGCRFSEAADLKVKDCDLLEGKIWFLDTKNGEDRQAFIIEPLLGKIKVLCDPKEAEDFVFHNASGNQLIPQCYNSDLIRRAKKAGIKKRVHPHLFRHSFATHLLSSGVDITRVAGLLGHRDIQTTYQNYVHLASDDLQKASSKFPLAQIHLPAKEKLKQIMEDLKKSGLFDDPDFTYQVSNNKIVIEIEGKKCTNEADETSLSKVRPTFG